MGKPALSSNSGFCVKCYSLLEKSNRAVSSIVFKRHMPFYLSSHILVARPKEVKLPGYKALCTGFWGVCFPTSGLLHVLSPLPGMHLHMAGNFLLCDVSIGLLGLSCLTRPFQLPSAFFTSASQPLVSTLHNVENVSLLYFLIKSYFFID